MFLMSTSGYGFYRIRRSNLNPSFDNDILLKEVLFGEDNVLPVESIGQLVPLGYAVASFTPVAYQRGHLPRSSTEISSRGQFRT